MHERNVFFPFLLPVRFSVRCEAYVIQGIAQDKLFLPSQGMLSNENVTRWLAFRLESITEISLHYPLLHVFFTYHSLSVSRSSVFQKVGITRKLDWRVWIAARREIFTTSENLLLLAILRLEIFVPSPLGRKFNPAAFNPRNFLISDIYTRLFVDMERFESLHVSREQSATGYPVLRKESIEEFVS